MYKISFDSESFTPAAVAFSLMVLRGNKEQDLKPEEIQRESTVIKDGIKLIEAFESAERFVVEAKQITSKEYEIYRALRQHFFKQRLGPCDLGYEYVERLIDLEFIRVLLRLSRAKDEIKKKLIKFLENPEEFTEKDSGDCQRFFNTLANSMTVI